MSVKGRSHDFLFALSNWQKPRKPLSGGRFSGLESKSGLPEYEVGVITTQSGRLVKHNYELACDD
jgi:hypothetical protein